MDVNLNISEPYLYLKQNLKESQLCPFNYANLYKAIESQIEKLNKEAVQGSDALLVIKKALKELDSVMDTSHEGIELTPFAKKLRDLNKSLSIHYSDYAGSFPMEYHGMGTRSWSSLLSLKAFVSFLADKTRDEGSVFFPILAIEETEAHLHPNAQKQIYSQMKSIEGQKIISTHSPYLVASAQIKEIRSLYKEEKVVCGKVNLNKLKSEDISKIESHVINSHGDMIFSRCIIFSEGKTESQALPIFAESFFDKPAFSMGLTFVDVGGQNYLPFLKVANSLNIPWIIFSDGEKQIIEAVNKKINEAGHRKHQMNDVFLDNGNDFEKQVIEEGYQAQIKEALKSLNVDRNGSDEQISAKSKEIDGYDDESLYKEMKSNKIVIGYAIAKEIVKNNGDLPPKIKELFKNIEKFFKKGRP